MTSEPATLLLAVVAGALLGLFFFGGLWWTVRHGLTARHPAWLFVGSLLLRTTVVIAGFWWVSDGLWDRLLACLVGFLVVRLVMTRALRQSRDGASVAGRTEEGRHAP